MYRSKGHEIFIVDGHVHFWNASPQNWRNQWGEGWIRCFHDYQTSLSPEEYIWSFEKFCQYDEQTMIQDLFFKGHVDMGIFTSTYLYEFYKKGFNTHIQNHVLKQKYPERFILCGAFDPRAKGVGLKEFRKMAKDYPIQGVKLYTAEWRNGSRGWSLKDPWAYKYLEACRELGIKNIHVHKGPTVYPLNRDAFDVSDVDQVATDFPDLNFIVEHIGLPRLEDFCWIATQDKNIYAGLSVASAFIHKRKRYFAEIMANLLFWLGEDRILFASDYAIWSPKWIVEEFMSLELPDDIKQEYGVDLTPQAKRKVLGENAARLYGIDIAVRREKLSQDPIGLKMAEVG
jgi:predicted TIM-barrel fold metal-dependent hydrolase